MSNVIKAHDSRRLSGALQGLDLRDIAEQAEALLASARAQAERIVQEAHERAESEREVVRQTAYRKGYEQGMAAGSENGRDEALAEARKAFAKDQASLVSALMKLVRDFDQRRERMYASARLDVVVLAIAIASRLSRKFSSMEDIAPDAAVQSCEEALALVREATEVVIRVHPEDSTALEHLVDQMTSAVKSSRHIRIVEEPGIDRGGVRVESADSEVDATITTRIERIADELVTDWRRRMKDLSIKS